MVGIGSNVAGGMLIVGDVGALIKNGWRATPLSDTPVNGLETTLSALGLATELAVGAGEAADVPISSVRAIVAHLGKSSFTDLLVLLLKRGLSNARDLPKFAVFVSKLVSKPAFLKVSKEVLTSEQAMEAAIKNVDDFGDDFVDALGNAATTTSGLGKSAARAANTYLDALRNAPAGSPLALAYNSIKSAPDTQKVLESMVKIFEAGINSKDLNKILENVTLFNPSVVTGVTTSYKQYDLFLDFGDIAKVADRGGLDRLVTSLKNTGNGRWGFRYELEVAAYLVREQGVGAVDFISKLVRNAEGKLVTDIDVVVNGVYYQAKRSKSAFSSARGGSFLSVLNWVNKARADGATKIIYVTPDLSQIPSKSQKAFEALQNKGIDVSTLAIPFK